MSQMEYDMDVIRSERRRNSDSIYNLKQYRGLYRHSKNDENHSVINERIVMDGYYTNKSDRTVTKRKFISQILPSKLVTDKRPDESIIDCPTNNVTNRRRTSDTYSPYGTRHFPSLRQRSPSIDSNMSVSVNSLDFHGRKSDVNNPTNGTSDCNNSLASVTTTRSSKDLCQLSRPVPVQLPHNRISLTAPQQLSMSAKAASFSTNSSPYNNNSSNNNISSNTNKSKNLLTNATLMPHVK